MFVALDVLYLMQSQNVDGNKDRAHIIAGENPMASVRVDAFPPALPIELASMLPSRQFVATSYFQCELIITLSFVRVDRDD